MSDEFEFKPLTEGLGFHKKVIELKEDSPSLLGKSIHPQSTPASAPIKPLGAPSEMPSKGLKVPGWSAALSKHDFLKEKTGVKIRLEPVAAAWPSAIFDGTMILGMALVFSAAVFAITKIELSVLIEMLRTDGAAQLASFFILFCVFEIYTVACRSFFGKTLGEWAFDYRLGTPEEQLSVAYPLQVAFRSLLISMTGFILFPLLDTILGKDILGKISGASLFMEKR